MTLFLLPVLGFFIGMIIIALGGGGGGFYVGVLTALFNVAPATAASTSLATIIPTTTVGMIAHWKAGNVNFKLGSVMMVSAMIGAVIGSMFSDYVPDEYYNKITGILLLALSVQMFFGYLKQKKQKIEVETTKKYTFGDLLKAVFYGVLGGALSGLVGISGTAPIVAGLIILGCKPLEIVGTSVFVLIGISTTGFLMHLGLGNVDWELVGLLILGTTLGAFLAPSVLAKFDKQKTEKVLIPIIVIMTFVMSWMVILK